MLSHEANHAPPHAPAQGKLRRSAKFLAGPGSGRAPGSGPSGAALLPGERLDQGAIAPARRPEDDQGRRPSSDASRRGLDPRRRPGRQDVPIDPAARKVAADDGLRQDRSACPCRAGSAPAVPNNRSGGSRRGGDPCSHTGLIGPGGGGRAPFHARSAASSTTDRGGSDEDRRRPRRRPRRSSRRASASPRSWGRTRRWRPPTPAPARPGGGRASAPPARPGDLGATFARTSPARRAEGGVPRDLGPADRRTPDRRTPDRHAGRRRGVGARPHDALRPLRSNPERAG